MMMKLKFYKTRIDIKNQNKEYKETHTSVLRKSTPEELIYFHEEIPKTFESKRITLLKKGFFNDTSSSKTSI